MHSDTAFPLALSTVFRYLAKVSLSQAIGTLPFFSLYTPAMARESIGELARHF